MPTTKGHKAMRIQLYKWQLKPHYGWPVVELGSDLTGTWFGCPSGTVWTRGDTDGIFDDDLVLVVPRDEWWIAEFTAEQDGLHTYIHVCTIPEVSNDEISAVDLDLDVLKLPGEPAFVVDEDEFAQNMLELEYPEELISMARVTGDELVSMADDPEGPFGTSVEYWMERLKERLRHTSL